MRELMALLALVSLGGCTDDPEETEPEPVDVGILTSVTGDLAGYGDEVTDATNLAFEQINDAGGVLDGRPLRIFLQDDATLEEVARAGYSAMLARRVPVILGPSFSGGALAAADLIRSGATLTIGQSTTSNELTTLDDGGWFFRVIPTDAAQGIVLAELLVESGRQRLCVVSRDDSWGNGLADTVLGRLAELAPAAVVVRASYAPELADLSHVLDPCDALVGEADVGLVFITFTSDGALLIDSAADRGFNAGAHRFFLTDGNLAPALLEQIEDPSVLDGALGTVPSGPDPATPAGERLRDFSSRFEDRFGRPPFPGAENAYDAAWVAALAIELAASATDRGAVLSALSSIGSGAQVAAGDWGAMLSAIAGDGSLDFEGASGSVNLDLTTGDLQPPFYIAVLRVNGGALEPERVVTVEAR